MDHLVRRLFELLLSNTLVYAVGSGICVVAFIAYWRWPRPRFSGLTKDLSALTASLEGVDDGDWQEAKDRGFSASTNNQALTDAWRETAAGIVKVPTQSDEKQYVSFGTPQARWSPQSLLSASMNLRLAEAVPNLLVGVGLLFTFFFLTVALIEATSALSLGGTGAAPTDITSATRGLLAAAGGKFITSLAGLAASILWTFFYKKRMGQLAAAANKVLTQLRRFVDFDGGERFVVAQQDSLEYQKGLSEELLEESRKQTGTLQNFQTELATSLGREITSAFAPQMEAMTSKLVASIEGLSQKMGAMNQEALRDMAEEFTATLKESTESEMTQLRSSLTALSEQLTNASSAIGEGAGKAAEQIDGAGAAMLEHVNAALNSISAELAGAGTTIRESAEQAAQKLDRAGTDLFDRIERLSGGLAHGAEAVEQAAASLKVVTDDLNASVGDAAALGTKGSVFLQEALGTAEKVFTRLQSSAEGIKSASNTLEQVGGRLSEVADGVAEMTHEQQSVVNAVREATPNALSSVQRVTALLEQTISATQSAMEQARQSMIATSKTLQATVAEITVGVGEYSKTVADLHRRMDAEFAKAVGSLDKSINEFIGVAEELGERMNGQATVG